MKAQRRIGVDLSWPRLTSIFLIDVAVLAVARHWPGAPKTADYAWWVGVGVAALVLVAGVLTYRRTPLASTLAARLLDRFVDPQALLAQGCTPAFDHTRRFSQQPVGIREHQGRLVSVIGVERAARHSQAEVSSTLPIGSIAAVLRHSDVCLDAIDIVSVGWPTALDTHDGAALDGGTWLILRMDPQRNVAAVAARDSVAGTLAAVTERLAQDLDGVRCAAHALTAAEITGVDVALLAGLHPENVRTNRRRIKQKQPQGPRESITSFWVSPQDITDETLEQLWDCDTNAVAVTVRLVPRTGGTQVSTWVRYHSDRRLPKQIWSGLNRLTGRQVAAVCASLPNPAVRSPLVVPGRVLREGEDLAVPVGAHR